MKLLLWMEILIVSLMLSAALCAEPRGDVLFMNMIPEGQYLKYEKEDLDVGASDSSSETSSSHAPEPPMTIWDYFVSFFFSLFWYSTAFGFLVVLVFSVALVVYYAGKGTKWYVYIVTVLGWVISFSVVFLIPLDIGLSTCYSDVCLLSSDRIFLDIFWQVVYWISLLLTWIVSPFLQSYVMAGEFSVLRKTLRSLKENFIFYGALLVGWSGFVIYILIASGWHGIQHSFNAVKGVVVAGSYFWGLFLMISFLSYGLIDIPRRLWFHSSLKKNVKRCKFYAERYYARFISSKRRLNEVLQRIKVISSEVPDGDKLKPYVTILENETAKINVDLSRLETGFEEEGISSSSQKVLRILRYIKYIALLDIPFPSEDEDEYDVPDVTYSYISSTRRKLRNAYAELLASEKRWDDLVKRYMFLNHVIECGQNKNRVYTPIGGAPAPTSFFKIYYRKIEWIWYFFVYPVLAKILAVFLAVNSVIIVYSELIFFIPAFKIKWLPFRLDFSVISLVLNSGYVGDVYATLFVTFPFLYMSVCVYYSFFQLSLFNYFRMSKRRTDNNSLLFSAAYTCRLFAPLCYNFLCITHRTINDQSDYGYTTVVFSGVMGDMYLVPLLGPYVNIYFPVFVVVLSILILFNVHIFILNKMRMDFFYYGSGRFSEEKISIGEGYLKGEAERRNGRIRSDILFVNEENKENIRRFDVDLDDYDEDEESDTVRLARRSSESEMTNSEKKRWEIRKKYNL